MIIPCNDKTGSIVTAHFIIVVIVKLLITAALQGKRIKFSKALL